MGDCRIRILIANELLPAAGCAASTKDDELRTVTHTASADSTFCDVWETVIVPLGLLTPAITVWDCTLHPPKDITEWLTLYNEKSGTNAKTLYDAAWFPSGTWQILPKGKHPRQTSTYDDYQYNLPAQQEQVVSTAAVRLVANNDDKMTPSQVLQSVTERFGGKGDTDDDTRAREIRREKRQQQAVKEAERHAKLEKQIQKLGSSTSNVSQQVRRMLIKSRCTGSSSLKMQDRIYMHIVVVDGEKTTEDYRYFSQQDTVARVVSSLASQVKLPREAELLVKTKRGDDAVVYRRLPVTMRLYEAISGGYLLEIDSVVVRCFTPPEEEATTSVLDEVEAGPQCESDEMQLKSEEPKVHETNELQAAPSEEEMAITEEGADQDLYGRLTLAVAAMDEASSKGKKKKASTTSAKVRTMLIKSKAKGDAKRVPKMDDRFFMELVVVNDVDGQSTASVSPVFLAKSDQVARVLRDCVDVPAGFDATILVPTGEGMYRKVPDNISLKDAEAQGLFKAFDRVLIRLYKP